MWHLKRLSIILPAIFIIHMLQAQPVYDSYPVYTGTDLGLTYTKAHSRFRIWSPPADKVELLLYHDGEREYPYRIVQLTKDINGTWFTELKGDMKGVYYTFKVNINHTWSSEVTDPYAKACGINGKRAMVVDLSETNPSGWSEDVSPDFSSNNLATDAVIYELHVRDASIDPHSGIKGKGKFTGLSETGTHTSDNLSTGLSHIKELGVTHIHLLPFYDYNSVDEHAGSKAQYNWGYDPSNYNIPEGSYSTNASDGVTRIRELKQMIAAFHRNGLRIVMDVVYNHTALTEKSNFNQLVPGYYYRHKKGGGFSDASSCGNETASEMPMMRKFMIESLVYWVKEYHIDGFRFDLMGIHDIETMNLISRELRTIKPDILLYGEGWTGGTSPLPDSLRALKENVSMLDGIAVFSDDIRHAVKGSVFDYKEKGFASGAPGLESLLKSGIVASCPHPQVYDKAPYAISPANIISYCECHDNHTLWDKLSLSNPDATVKERKKMHRLALSIILTSQGISFLHAGTEFLRSKDGIENSFKSPDSINAIHWNLKKEHIDLVTYVQSLIRIRRQHPAFRMTTARQIKEYIAFIEDAPSGTVAYILNGEAIQDSWKKILVAFNGTMEEKKLEVAAGNWVKGLTSEHIQLPETGELILPPLSAAVFYNND